MSTGPSPEQDPAVEPQPVQAAEEVSAVADVNLPEEQIDETTPIVVLMDRLKRVTSYTADTVGEHKVAAAITLAVGVGIVAIMAKRKGVSFRASRGNRLAVVEDVPRSRKTASLVEIPHRDGARSALALSVPLIPDLPSDPHQIIEKAAEGGRLFALDGIDGSSVDLLSEGDEAAETYTSVLGKMAGWLLDGLQQHHVASKPKE